tara:strand:+ start:195 stop:434 length:240 start_codon:yes stop_codon:yes gene_type:complete
MNKLIQALKKGVVIISFRKIDSGEIRVMPSTLNPELIPNVTNPLNVDSSSDTIMVWSLDKNSWRDIRSDTITEWKIEHE